MRVRVDRPIRVGTGTNTDYVYYILQSMYVAIKVSSEPIYLFYSPSSYVSGLTMQVFVLLGIQALGRWGRVCHSWEEMTEDITPPSPPPKKCIV